MLVEDTRPCLKERRCLLGRQRNWPKGMYSTLAGFVEIGESLEQAVAREVYEESGIKTKNIRYVYSQPWPFPASMMLGFLAEATTTDILVDTNELEDAKWFSVSEISKFGEWGNNKYKFQLPRKDSIARLLIDSWMTP